MHAGLQYRSALRTHRVLVGAANPGVSMKREAPGPCDGDSKPHHGALDESLASEHIVDTADDAASSVKQVGCAQLRAQLEIAELSMTCSAPCPCELP